MSRTLVTTNSSYFSMEDCKVKEMVGNRGEEAFRVELQLKDGQKLIRDGLQCLLDTNLSGMDTSRYGVFVFSQY